MSRFRLGDGEFDEFFDEAASVHVERLDERVFWIGITPKDGRPEVSIRTGVEDGKWFFLIEEDSDKNEGYMVERAV